MSLRLSKAHCSFQIHTVSREVRGGFVQMTSPRHQDKSGLLRLMRLGRSHHEFAANSAPVRNLKSREALWLRSDHHQRPLTRMKHSRKDYGEAVSALPSCR